MFALGDLRPSQTRIHARFLWGGGGSRVPITLRGPTLLEGLVPEKPELRARSSDARFLAAVRGAAF
jgi:hypothetical protein